MNNIYNNTYSNGLERLFVWNLLLEVEKLTNYSWCMRSFKSVRIEILLILFSVGFFTEFSFFLCKVSKQGIVVGIKGCCFIQEEHYITSCRHLKKERKKTIYDTICMKITAIISRFATGNARCPVGFKLFPCMLRQNISTLPTFSILSSNNQVQTIVTDTRIQEL